MDNNKKTNIKLLTDRFNIKILNDIDKLIKEKYKLKNNEISDVRNKLIKNILQMISLFTQDNNLVRERNNSMCIIDLKDYKCKTLYDTNSKKYKVSLDIKHYEQFIVVCDRLNINKNVYMNKLLQYIIDINEEEFNNSIQLPNMDELFTFYNTIDYLTIGTLVNYFFTLDIEEIQLIIRLLTNEVNNIYENRNIQILIATWILNDQATNELEKIHDMKYFLYLKKYLQLQLDFFALLYLNYNVKTPKNKISTIYSNLINKHRTKIKKLSDSGIKEYLIKEIMKLSSKDYQNKDLTDNQIKIFDTKKIINYKNEIRRIRLTNDSNSNSKIKTYST